MPEHFTDLDDSTFYLHSDIVGRIDDYRRNRPKQRKSWIARIFFF